MTDNLNLTPEQAAKLAKAVVALVEAVAELTGNKIDDAVAKALAALVESEAFRRILELLLSGEGGE